MPKKFDVKKKLSKLEISAVVLKWIAVIGMLLNHICIGISIRWAHHHNYFLNTAHWYLTRFAIIIFCFQISEGMHYTHNRFKYILWLFIFALISEIPFDLALRNKWMDMKAQNVFWTLGLGALTIYAYDNLKDKPILWILAALAAMALATLMRSDYEWWGILFILVFYIFRDNRKKQILWFLLIFVLSMPIYYCVGDVIHGLTFKQIFTKDHLRLAGKNMLIEAHALAALPLFCFYKGKKGKTVINKWFFYGLYPGHLILIHGLASVIILCMK